MTEFREFSRLPEDPAYWQEQEARILSQTAVPAPAGDVRTVSWWTPFVDRAWQLGVLATAAAIAALLLLPPRAASAPAVSLLPLPADPMFEKFFDAASPPPVGSLVIGPQQEGAR